MNEKEMHFETIETADKDTTVMEFSGNQDDNQNNYQHNQNNNRRNPNSRGYWPLILIGITFIALVALLIYIFGFRNNNSILLYGNNDVTYTLVDSNGKAQVNSDGTPDWTDYSKSTDIKTVIDTDNAGTLAKIIVSVDPSSTTETDNVKLVVKVIRSNTTNEIVYLQGTFNAFDSTKNAYVTYTYQATLDKVTYETYVKPLLEQSSVSSYFKYNVNYIEQIESTTDWSWVTPMIIAVLVTIVAIIFIRNMMKSVGGSNNPMSGFVNNVARKQNGSSVRFGDVAGCDEAKAELVEMVDYFHSRDKYTRLGAKLPHGVLLVGPPGTGKTLLAKAVAGEANVPFYSISGSDFVEMYVGVGASRVRSLFKTAKNNAPCLIFIDEIDAVGRQRGAGLGGGNDEREQTLNELLVEMDGFEDNNGVIVMAATNRDDVLDPALTRPGRFDRKITVDLPDKNGRAAILKVHARNKKLAPNVSFDNIASRTVGFSGADLANILNDAAILAVRSNRNAITTSDIDEAIDRAISGPAKRSHLEEAERKQVAYHEAGHAVIGIFLPYSDKVQKITIIPRGRTGGHVLMTPEKDRFLMTKNQLIARIVGYLGGRTSEEIFFGDVSTGASNDIEVATNIARGMVTEYGMSELGPIQYEKPGGSVFLGRDYNSSQANYSSQTALEIDKQIRLIIEDCHKKCHDLLIEHKDDVELIAKTLIENETITADQISYLLEHRELPKEDEHKIDADIKLANPNNIILYPGYEKFYQKLDNIIASKPSKLIVVVSVEGGTPIADANFKKACLNNVEDMSKVGMLFVDITSTYNISTTIETFAEHLETYAGVDTTLIKTDEMTLRHLQGKFVVKPVEEKTIEQKEVVEQAKEEAKEVKDESSSIEETKSDEDK